MTRCSLKVHSFFIFILPRQYFSCIVIVLTIILEVFQNLWEKCPSNGLSIFVYWDGSRCSTSHLLFYLSLSCLFSVFIFLIPSSQPVYLLVISMGPLPEIHAANSWPLSHFSVLNQVHFLSDWDSWIFWRFIDQAHFMPELEYCYKKRF